MAGITDWPFRLLCFEQGCDCATTEMVSALGYAYAPKSRAVQSLLERHEGEKKLLVQIFGKEPEYMARTAEALSATGIYDGIDVNMGCPAHKVASGGEGSGLMRNPALAEKILRAVTKASSIPVSVKMRLGWDDASRNAVDMARMAEDCGVSEIAVHGRTRMQMYAGEADWEAIAEVKRAVRIPVLGNGDIFRAEDCLRKIADSGVDGVLIGRGALGNPWLFRQIKDAMEGRTVSPVPLRVKMETAIRHYEMMLAWKPKHIAVAEMRKHIGWYLSGQRGAASIRDRVNHMDDPAEVMALLQMLEEEAE